MQHDWISKYLERINYQGHLAADWQCLSNLHFAHLLAVPFEDLDIHWGNPLSLTDENLFNKVVQRKRGGFCYELNYLFSLLLQELGFEVRLLAAQVHGKNGALGDPFDHMALLVNDRWLADVGFGGSSFLHPLSLSDVETQRDVAGMYKIERLPAGNFRLLQAHKPNLPLEPMYDFTMQGQTILDFQAQCQWKQQAAESHFVKNKICTRATLTGRYSLLNDTLTLREQDHKKTIRITDRTMEYQLLLKYFNITR